MSLSGLHWRNVREREPDAFEIADCGFQSFVVMSNAGPELPLAIHERYPDALIIARLYAPAGTLPTVDDVVPYWAMYINALEGACDHFILGNEPDLEYPGVSPEQFVEWYASVLGRLSAECRDFQAGFPMPSVNGNPAWDYAERCARGIEISDFLAEHCYWQEAWQEDDWNWGSRYFLTHQRWPTKKLHVTEYGCTADIDPAQKAAGYLYYVGTLPPYVISANAFWMAGGDGWPGLWVDRDMASIMAHVPRSEPVGASTGIIEGASMPEFKLGFADLAGRLGPDVVGEPQMEEASIPVNSGQYLAVQLTNKGCMMYATNGQPVFLPAAADPLP